MKSLRTMILANDSKARDLLFGRTVLINRRMRRDYTEVIMPSAHPTRRGWRQGMVLWVPDLCEKQLMLVTGWRTLVSGKFYATTGQGDPEGYDQGSVQPTMSHMVLTGVQGPRRNPIYFPLHGIIQVMNNCEASSYLTSKHFQKKFKGR